MEKHKAQIILKNESKSISTCKLLKSPLIKNYQLYACYKTWT